MSLRPLDRLDGIDIGAPVIVAHVQPSERCLGRTPDVSGDRWRRAPRTAGPPSAARGHIRAARRYPEQDAVDELALAPRR